MHRSHLHLYNTTKGINLSRFSKKDSIMTAWIIKKKANLQNRTEQAQSCSTTKCLFMLTTPRANKGNESANCSALAVHLTTRPLKERHKTHLYHTRLIIPSYLVFEYTMVSSNLYPHIQRGHNKRCLNYSVYAISLCSRHIL